MEPKKRATTAQKALGDFAPRMLSLTDELRHRADQGAAGSRALKWLAGLVWLAGCASAGQPGPATATARAEDGVIAISRPSDRPPTPGGAANFTGNVVVQPLFQTTPHTRALGASVSFEPGARTAWHTHPAGQTLVVSAGTGWVQQWNGERQEVGSTGI